MNNLGMRRKRYRRTRKRRRRRQRGGWNCSVCGHTNPENALYCQGLDTSGGLCGEMDPGGRIVVGEQQEEDSDDYLNDSSSEDEDEEEEEREIATAPLTTLQPTKTKQKKRGGRRKTRRRRRRRRTRRRRRRRQRGGGKKKGRAKTQKLMKAAKKRSRKKQPPQLLKKLGIQKYQTLNEDNIEWGGTIATNQTPSQENSLNSMLFFDTESNSNNENGTRAEAEERALSQFWLKKGYNPRYEPGLPKKKTKKATGTYAQLPKYAQRRSPLFHKGQFVRDVQTNADAGAMAAILSGRRRRSPSPPPRFDVDEWYDEYDAGFGELLPIDSEIVGHGEKNGKRFYKIRLGPSEIPEWSAKGRRFENYGKPHTKEYADSKARNEDFDAEQLEEEATGLPDLQKLIDDYVADHPSAGEESSGEESSLSSGGHRRRKRRKKRTRRKQRGGMDLSPKFRYTAQDFLDDAKTKETDHKPKPWW